MSQAPTKSYFIDINRYSAQTHSDDTTNIWDFNLNDTILAPQGSAISIHQAFINQKGITGQSIEFEEDLSETIQYYLYITDDIHPCPVAQVPNDLGKRYGGISGEYKDLNLLNNLAETGREGGQNLWGTTIQNGTKQKLTPEWVGGSGTPLILSSKPSLSETGENRIITGGNINGAGHNAYSSIGALNTSETIVLTGTPAEVASIRVGATVTGTGIPTATVIMTGNPSGINEYTITLSKPTTITSPSETVTIAPFNTQWISNVDTATLTVLAKNFVGGVGRHRIVGSGIPLNTFVNTVDLATNSVSMRTENTVAPIVNAHATATQHDQQISFYADSDFYCYPVPSTAFITIKKGVYGIEQLTSIINRQINGQFKSGSEIPFTNVDTSRINGTYDGTINVGNAGFTRTVMPHQYHPSPDGIPLSEVNPATTAGAPNHTFIPALDYAMVQSGLHNKLQPSRVSFTARINPAVSGAGYVGYLQDNQNGNLVKNADGTYTRYIPDDDGVAYLSEAKYSADYNVGKRGLVVGAPEFNIDYDTNLSGFSINNLHSSYRMASTDLLGNDISDAGKVGVGLKRMADILDWPSYSSRQSLWGDPQSADTSTDPTARALQGDFTDGSSVITNVKRDDGSGTFVTDMNWVSVGATVLSEHLPASGATILDIYTPNSDYVPDDNTGAVDYFVIQLDTPAINTAVNRTYTVQPHRINNTIVKQMNQSYERPVSRIGGAIVYNWAKGSASKWGTRSAVVDNVGFNSHASFKDFFNNEGEARKIWKSKTLWGKLGFSYDQLNSSDYMENIIQYTHPTSYKLRGTTTDTKLDLTAINMISTQNNPSQSHMPYSAGSAVLKDAQAYNNWDVATCRTQRCRRRGKDAGKSTDNQGDNQSMYAGSRYEMSVMYNIVTAPTPLTAENLPNLSDFGYYLITSDLVPTYKDIVAKGDPIGLLGVVPKTNLSNQDFIPLADSDIVQVLNQDTVINNIRVKVLNPDLSNPALAQNSSIILRIDVPIEPPVLSTELEAKTPKPQKRCPKTGETPCKCPKGETCDKSKKENLHKKK